MSNTVRKIRSDKKRDVKPTVHYRLYDTVSRISYITNTPMKDVAEAFCINGLYSLKVIETAFETKFRRSYIFANNRFPKFFPGNEDKIGERAVKDLGERRRITIRFDQHTHDKIAELAYALDVTVSSATSMLLEASIANTDILNQYLEEYVEQTLDPQRKRQLKEVVRYLRDKNIYHDTDITLADILSSLLDEIWEYGKSFKKSLEKWLDDEDK